MQEEAWPSPSDWLINQQSKLRTWLQSTILQKTWPKSQWLSFRLFKTPKGSFLPEIIRQKLKWATSALFYKLRSFLRESNSSAMVSFRSRSSFSSRSRTRKINSKSSCSKIWKLSWNAYKLEELLIEACVDIEVEAFGISESYAFFQNLEVENLESDLFPEPTHELYWSTLVTQAKVVLN